MILFREDCLIFKGLIFFFFAEVRVIPSDDPLSRIRLKNFNLFLSDGVTCDPKKPLMGDFGKYRHSEVA